jgi:hypothetical protein
MLIPSALVYANGCYASERAGFKTYFSLWLGDDDMLIPSASVYSKRYCAAESDNIYNDDFTI